jgi:hypothetical protein
MTEITHVPEKYVDEVSARTNVSHDAFIKRDGAGWKLCPADPDEAEDIESFPHVTLTHGDIVLFHSYRHLGEYELDVAEDGTWKVAPEPPCYANSFGLPWYWESMTHNIPDLIEHNGDEIKPGSKVEIEAWWWSDSAEPWQFTVEGETARFVKVEGRA